MISTLSITLRNLTGSSQPVGPHHIAVFNRIIRHYDNYILLAALIAGLSVGALQFSEFHPAATSATQAAEGFLTSAACSAVFAVMLAVMLSFHFEGHDSLTRLDYRLAWTPLILLDWSIVAVLIGLLCRYWERSKCWSFGLLVASVGLVSAFVLWVALMMWRRLRNEGRKNEDEQGGQDAARNAILKC